MKDSPAPPLDATPGPRQRRIVIRPSRGLAAVDFAELWEYRELVSFLALRDVKVRYKQTALGAAWAILQPLFTMLAFSLFFGRLAKVPSDGLPYPLFALCALLPWQLFATALTQASQSLVSNQALVTKVYFPRLAIPLAAVLAAFVDFAITGVLLAAVLAWYRVVPGQAVLALPLFTLLAAATALGAGLWLSALNVRYRDVRHTLGFLLQLWLVATPIAYPSSLIDARWRVLYGLNPMAGAVDGFRWALVPGAPPPGVEVAAGAAAAAVLLVSGALFFRSMERSFADTI